MSITSLFSLKVTTDFYLNSLEDKLISNGSFISSLFIKSYSPSKNNYDSLAKEFSNISKARVTIIAANGVVIGESDTDSRYMQNHSSRPV
jgi:two-component system phosphate regulon sensor histidine kinase PhoR